MKRFLLKIKQKLLLRFLIWKQEGGKKMRNPGGLKGMVTIPDDFNDPLDDLKEYM